MRKSVKRLYEHKRTFDYDEASECRQRKLKSFIKKRAHRRLRNQLKKIYIKDEVA